MSRKMLWGATLGECSVLALVWGMLALPGNALAAPKPRPPETKCSDGRDNDKDGLIDCCDPDCCEDGACGGTGCPDATSCTGGGDDGGGGDGGDILVCVTFDDAADDLVTSDGGGPYCDGVDGIVAFIGNRRGGLKLDTSESPWQVVLNFPECPRLIGGDCSTDARLATMTDILTGDKLDLRAMAEGEIRFADFQIAFPSDLSRSTPNLIIFGGHNLGPNACGTSLLVTRVDAVTWTIEARVGFCTFAAADPDHPTNCGVVDPTDPANVCDCACLHEVGKGNKRELTDIDFALPFKITIVAQP